MHPLCANSHCCILFQQPQASSGLKVTNARIQDVEYNLKVSMNSSFPPSPALHLHSNQIETVYHMKVNIISAMATWTSDSPRQAKGAPVVTAQLKSQRAGTFEVRDDTVTRVDLEVWSHGTHLSTSEHFSFILTKQNRHNWSPAALSTKYLMTKTSSAVQLGGAEGSGKWHWGGLGNTSVLGEAAGTAVVNILCSSKLYIFYY